MAFNLGLETGENGIHGLYDQPVSICEVSDFDVNVINNDSKKEWLIFMNISFGKGRGKKLKNAVQSFNTKHTMEWFESRGVPLMIQGNNIRLPPISKFTKYHGLSIEGD